MAADPKKYTNWAEVLADASTGSVAWKDASASKGLYPYLLTHNVTVPEVQSLLAVVKRTQPKSDWVAGNWLSVVNGQIAIGTSGIPGPVEAPLTPSVPSVPGIGNITDFLNLLASPNLWIRVGEFAVGAVLLAVGVAAMTRPSTAPVTRAVRKVAGRGF